MENADIKILTNEKIFKNLINDKNREKFFDEFIDEDEMTKYVINGLGEIVILSKDELVSLIHNNDTKFEIVNPYDGYCTMIINGSPTILEYL